MSIANRIKEITEFLIVFTIDLLSVYVLLRLAVLLRTDVLPRIYGGFPADFSLDIPIGVWWVYPVWIFFFSYEGLYSERFSFWDEVLAIWRSCFFSTAGILIVVSIGKLSDATSRTVILLTGLLALLFLPPIRQLSKALLRRAGFLRRRVLILGAGETGRLILQALRKEPNYGYEVIGFLDDDVVKAGRVIDGVKVHRGIDRASNYINRCGVDDLFIAMPGAGRERLRGLINSLQHKVGRILFVPDLFGIAVLGTNLQHFFQEQALVLVMKNNLARQMNVLIKRCFDLSISFLVIPLLVLPFLLIVAAIRLDSKGPAILSQQRIGRRGREFRCYKFRTMFADAEDRLAELLNSDSSARQEWEHFWKLRNDPRVTRVGKFLRATSLDELPQLFNVLRGDMSLVGPRPYLVREKDDLGEHSHIILLSRPGITGLWQVSGRSNTGYDYRIALDEWYVRNWNLWLDIVIIFRTFGVVLKREGAY